jgi:hypothetical protein
MAATQGLSACGCRCSKPPEQFQHSAGDAAYLYCAGGILERKV